MKLEWKTCFKIGASIFLLYLCIYYWAALSGFVGMIFKASAPLIIGCAAAYVINILMSGYEKIYFPKSQNKFVKKSRRGVCMVLALLTVAAVVVLIIGLVIPEFISCLSVVVAELPDSFKKLMDFLERKNLIPENIPDLLSSIDWKSKIGEIANMLTSGIGNVMGFVLAALSSVFSGIVTFVVAFIFAIYLLLDRDRLKAQFNRIMTRYMNESWYKRSIYVLDIMNDCFRRYIIGQCTEAVILGVLCTLGMLALRLPYASMIGALIGFTALIPIAGAYIGGGIGAFMIFMVSPVKALVFLIFLVILQQIEGNLIYPRVVGSSMGLPAIWVLAAITIGGGIMGILGMLLGVPAAATLYRLIKNDVNKDRLKAMENDGLAEAESEKNSNDESINK